jgi:large repetitive protein
MKTTRHLRNLGILLILCTAVTSLFAQRKGGLEPGWYTLGINAGLSYQQSDVPVWLRGGGLGITLAKNYIHKPNGGLDFDLRGRLMYSTSYGLSPDRNYNLTGNPAVNGTQFWDYTTYPAELNEPNGFIFNNHRTQMGELGLEAVFTFGRLRERTGIVFSVFGGLGIDWFRTTTDQGNNGRDYKTAYAALDTTAIRAERLRTLRNSILSNDFESLAEGFENSELGRVRIMPNWGIELGYDITKRFGIGLGHKVTYSGINTLDGFSIAGSRNDIHHYTYAQLYWRFNVKDAEQEPPEIIIHDPAFSPYSTRDPYKLLKATVHHVRNKSQVYVVHDGRSVDFTFRKGDIEVDLKLNTGINTIVIHAENKAGKTHKEQIIVLEEPESDEPVFIRFIRPESDGLTVPESRYDVTAEILHLENQREIRWMVNGRIIQKFGYDFSTKIFTSRINLVEGLNTLELEASNRKGRDRQTITIYYEKPILPPTIKIVQPAESPHRTTAATQSFIAELTDIDTRRGDQINIMYNGFATNRFEYDNARGRLTATFPLEPGQNFMTLTVINKSGNARADVVFIREQVVVPPAPVIVITSTNTGSYNAGSQNCIVSFRATVNGVNAKSDITLRAGNRNITDFTFNIMTKQVSADIPVTSGKTTITITATGPGGTVTERTEVTCQLPVIVPRPTVSITIPVRNAILTQPRQNMTATVREVTSRDQIEVRLNGRSLTSFNYNATNGEVTSNLNLQSGQNEVEVKVQTPGGSASDKITFTYKIPQPPVITVSAPVDRATLNVLSTDFIAEVTHITSKNQVRMTVNGNNFTGFNLDKGKVTAQLSLALGENTIAIRAENQDGTDSKEMKVNVNIPKPIITGINPEEEQVIVRQRAYNFVAQIDHVASRNQIVLTVNGRRVSNPAFNTTTKQLIRNVNLNEGVNTIVVEAVNPAGSARKVFEITYDTRVPTPPVVTILSASQPVSDPFNPDSGKSTVIATVQHVGRASDITFMLNGKSVSGFNFDPATGRLEHRIDLARGNNVIEIRATNADGTGSDSVEVKY